MSLVQDIHFVRSLRKDIRDVKLPTNILNSIETIHNCIKSGIDLNGWKKVDWRGNVKTNGPNPSQRSNNNGNNGGTQSYQKGSNFFNNRQESNNGSTHSAFNGRSRYNGFAGRQNTEQTASIPLTSGTITSVNTTTVSADGFRMPSNKYVSKFKKSSEKVDDTILNTIILGKLNKFSEPNYAEIKEFITHIIDNGETDMIKCFMKLVFEKAASEEMFCPLYAKLLSELSSRYPVLLTEMANLYSVYMAIFEEVSETKAENYNEVCKQNVEKKYRRGYSQFLAELIKHSVIDTDVFMKTILTIITQIENKLKSKESTKLIEEYADCLMKIMKAIQNTGDKTNVLDDDDDAEQKINLIRLSLKDDIFKRIKPLTVRNSENIGLSNKSRFTFLDIYEGIDNL